MRCLLLLACMGCDPYPLDDELRLDQLRWKGTHNSYHLEPEAAFPEWQYSHAPIGEQLENQGVRKLELDLYWDAANARLEVYHVPFFDALTTCATYSACLGEIAAFSASKPNHAPILVQVELKNVSTRVDAGAILEALDAVTRHELGDRLLTPDAVLGTHATLRDALALSGWPTLRTSRGKVLLFLLADSGFDALYSRGGLSLEGRALFVATSSDVPYRAVVLVDDPHQIERTETFASEGALVRTRADADGDLGAGGRNAAAYAGSAHIISTDYPVQRPGYWVGWPASEPMRCHPTRAPEGCRSEQIE